MPTWIAHMTKDGREQTLTYHLQQVARLSCEFARPFHNENLAAAAGLLHDIGKASPKAQLRMHGADIQVDHATAGAYEALQHFGPYANLTTAMAIAGHHGGLPDFGTKVDGPDMTTLYARYNRYRALMKKPDTDTEKQALDYRAYLAQHPIPASPTMNLTPAIGPNHKFTDAVNHAFLTRMVYSCLVDADFLDTEQFFRQKPRKNLNHNMRPLLKRYDKHMARMNAKSSGELNDLRAKIQAQARLVGRTGMPGLFTMTVPTGGGKTLASLGFALEHVVKQHMKRIIYVIPYTSIIDQTAQQFRPILGKNTILEHQSNHVFDEKLKSEQAIMKCTENWDMPVIVTTAVQFFESLYSNKPSQCRKLHNIADSVIIFDEAQLLPLNYIRPCVYAISQLVEHYHCSAVLCTATQPALKPILTEFQPDMTIREICPEPLWNKPVFRRTGFQSIGLRDMNVLQNELRQETQVLCVVNTRKTAQELYGLLADKDGTYCLTTLLYPKDRKRKLTEIKARLTAGLPCTVISTSLIEAGVDIDFPAVYREETGLDSILQTGGRCNRNGLYSSQKAVVRIFSLGSKPLPELSRRIAAYQAVRNQFQDITCPEAIELYFNQWLYLSGDKQQDAKNILPDMAKMNFKAINDAFRFIDDKQVTLYIPVPENEIWLKKIQTNQAGVKTYRKMAQYAVALYASQAAELRSAGLLLAIDEYTAILTKPDYYDEHIGLPVRYDVNRAVTNTQI